MYLSPLFFVPNDLLVAIYQKAVKRKHNKEFVELVFAEIKFRNLRIDKPVPLSESTLQILNLLSGSWSS